MADQRFLSREEQLVGKTIAEAETFGEWFLLRFTDGTYTACLGEGDGCDEEVGQYLTRPGPYELYSVGVMSKEEYEEHRNKEQDDERAKRRQQWEELNKEFGKEDACG